MAFDLNNPAGGKKSSLFAGNSSNDDPLADVKYTDDLAEDSKREFQALAKSYRERAKAEDKRFTQATDSEYWFCVCFKSREEKDEFLKAAGVKTKIMGDKYLEGKHLAASLNINIEY